MAMVISRKYEVVGQLGRGGMGVVYKVRHSALDTILALKVLPAYLMDNQEMIARFYREARVMARLRHHNIVRVLDIDHDETLNFHYFVMEYLQGKTLGEYLRERGPLPLPEVLDVARQVASALEYAHSHNPPVIHRDIKPSNIMIEDLSGRSVVMDFGIAKELGESEMTKSGVMIGTVKYCSPEQMRHEPLDGSADVYSLGIVMYEAYTGMQFFAGLDEHSVIGRVLDDTRENEPHFTRPAPPAFAALVTKAIAKARSKRYRTMADLLRDVDECRSALEDTKTVLLPGPGRSKAPSEEARDSVEDLEEQIRRLEEERQRRLVASVRAQAREARERAERERAAERAAALFQQGLTREEQAHKHLREGHYSLAQGSYQEAVDFFSQAREAAQAVAVVQNAEQARHAMVSAKAEAELYNAREKARSFYGRALALQARADELWEKKDYQQAGQGYAAAQKAFEDARELAYRETLREEAETNKAEMLAAKNAAMTAEAAELAVTIFQEAVLNEKRATTAMEREEFTQARELYLLARQKYELAQEQARLERQRRQALAGQQRARETRQRAETQGIKQFSLSSYQRAVEAQQQGDVRFAAHEYEQAVLAYGQACAAYEQGVQEAEEARRQQAAELVRQQKALAETGRESARQAREAARALARWAQECWKEAQRLEDEADQAWKAQNYVHASECAAAARQHYEQVRNDGEQERLRLQAITLSAYQRMEQARARAEQSKVNTRLAADFAQIQRIVEQGRVRAGQEDFAEACSLYEQAAQEFARLQQQAELQAVQAAAEQARQAAGAALQHVEEARGRAERVGAKTRFAAEFAQAQQAEEQGQKRAGQGDFAGAGSCYEQAAQLFVQLYREAVRQTAREAAEAARQHMEEVRERVTTQRQWAASLWAQAQECDAQAEQAYLAQEYEQAGRGYERACHLYEQAGEEAEREQLRQAAREHAESASKNMGQAREAARALAPWVPDLWKEAQRIEAEAERAWQAQEYPRAREHAEAACQCYEQVHRKGEQERLQSQALSAQQQALQEREGARAAEAEQYAPALYQQGVEAQERGEQHLTAQHWQAAAEAFEQAQGIFAQTLKNARRCKEQQAADAARESALAARRQADQYAELFPGGCEEAASFFREAEEAYRREDFPAAQAGFARCAALCQRVYADALLHRQREEAERARARAHELEKILLVAGSRRQKKQANKALLSGDRFFQQQQYTQAQAGYEEAAALLVALQPAAQPREEKTAIAPLPPTEPLADGSSGRRGIVPLFSFPRAALVLSSALVLAAGFSVVYLRRSAVAPDLRPPEEHIVTNIEKPASPEPTPADQPPIAPPASESADVPRVPETPHEEIPAVSPPEQVTTKTPLPVPPAPKLPLLTRITPQQEPGQELRVAEGQNVTFAVEARSPANSPLHFTWLLNGVERGKNKRWTYKPDFDEGEPQAKEVKVVVTDDEDHSIEHGWRVLVKDVDRPPKIITSVPSADTVSAATGSVVDFSVEAADPDKEDRLAYVWSLDGREVGRGQRWQFKVPAGAEAAARYRVAAEAVDQNNLRDRVVWNVTVKSPGAPPRIIDIQPRDEKLTVQVGQALDFAVTADLPGDARESKKSLRYLWDVEGEGSRTTDTGRYHLVKATPGTYQVTVSVVGPEGLQSAPRRWNVEVQPLAVALPPTTPASQLSEGEARAWLEVYRQAWEGKDIDKLIQLGEVSSQDASRLRGLLSGYKDFHVLLQNVEIHRDGNQARITFNRVDVLDGQSLPHPGQKSLTLEKDARGRLTRRP
jgi:hypothetical protein